MILSFGKHCRSGFICNPLWHVLLPYLCHILSIWEKTWQCHIHISELGPCNVPGAAALRTQWNRLKEQFADAESRRGLVMFLLWLTICFATLFEHMVSDSEKKWSQIMAGHPPLCFFQLSAVLTNFQSILLILFLAEKHHHPDLFFWPPEFASFVLIVIEIKL